MQITTGILDCLEYGLTVRILTIHEWIESYKEGKTMVEIERITTVVNYLAEGMKFLLANSLDDKTSLVRRFEKLMIEYKDFIHKDN